MNLLGKMKQKEKHSLLSAENVTIGELYTFTYNPDDQPDDPFHPDVWLREMHRTFKSLYGCRIVLYPEYSKLHRWHLHGHFYITNINYFYLKDLPKLIPYGTIEMDTIGDFQEWHNYERKSRHFVSELLETQPYMVHNYPGMFGVDHITIRSETLFDYLDTHVI